MDNTYASDYDRLLAQLNEELESDIRERDVEKEIRFMFEDTDMGRQLDINEWDVVFENDQWWIVADNGSSWSVNETEDAEHPFQFEAVGEVMEESKVNEDEDKEDEEEWDEKLSQARAERRGRDMSDDVVVADGGASEITVEDTIELARILGFEVDDAGNLITNIGVVPADEFHAKIVSDIEEIAKQHALEDGEVEESKVNEDEDKEEEDKEEEDEEEDTRDEYRGEDAEQGEELVGGRADGAKDEEFDPEQLRMGQHHELEHTENPAVALEIAKDHLRSDPLYYTKLKRMEAGECDHPEDEELYRKIGHGRPEVDSE